MKRADRSLDEFFVAARSEEPVVTDESVRELLDSTAPVQQNISLRRSLYSTKGIVMTSVAVLSAAGVIVLGLSLNTAQPPVHQPISAAPQASLQVTPPQQPAVVQVTPQKKEPALKRQIVIVNDDSKSTMPKELPAFTIDGIDETPVRATTNILAPKEIAKVPLQMAADGDLQKLGISRQTDGGVVFYMQTGKNKCDKYILPSSTWGLVLTNEENNDPTLAKITPTLVTDARGNKRLMYFTDENTAVSMSHSRTVNQIPGGSSNEDNTIVSYDNNTDSAKRKVVIMKKNIKRTVTDDQSSTATSAIPMVRKNNVVINDADGEISITNTLGDIQKLLAQDSTGKQLSKAMAKIIIHGNDGQVSISDKLDESALNNLLINDSLKAKLTKALSEIHNLKSSAPVKGIKIIVNDDDKDNIAKAEATAIPGNGNVNVVVNVEHPDSDADVNDVVINGAHVFPSMDLQSNMLDNLVPVLIRTATTTEHNAQDNTDYDNGIIFWYKHTPEFDKAINATPASVEQPIQHSDGVLSNASLFPNPASKETTVHFSLKAPRTISFTLHDILGRRIADLGMYPDWSIGDHEQHLDLGSVPAGIYLLAIVTDKGEQQIERIVITK